MSSAHATESKTMDCSDFLARYTDYDDSFADPAEHAEFGAHMDACPRCARYDRVLRKGRMLARQIPKPSPSPDFIPRLELRLESGPPAPNGSATRSIAVSGAVMVVLLLALVSGADLLRPDSAPALAHDHAAEPSAAGVGAAETARPLTLPPAALEDPAGWTAGRVDRRVASSYSPLVIGPPAYRAPRTVTLTSTATSRRTLD